MISIVIILIIRKIIIVTLYVTIYNYNNKLNYLFLFNVLINCSIVLFILHKFVNFAAVIFLIIKHFFNNESCLLVMSIR